MATQVRQVAARLMKVLCEWATINRRAAADLLLDLLLLGPQGYRRQCSPWCGTHPGASFPDGLDDMVVCLAPDGHTQTGPRPGGHLDDARWYKVRFEGLTS